jgi:hypothetical protein
MKFQFFTLVLVSMLIGCSHQPKTEASRKTATSESVYDCVNKGIQQTMFIVDGGNEIEITYSDSTGPIAKWEKESTDDFPAREGSSEELTYFGQGSEKNMKSLYFNLLHVKDNIYKAKGVMKNLNWELGDPIESKYIILKGFECTSG